MSKVVIITGGSSGIGLCTAAALRDRGCKVYELSRRDSEVEGITHLRCDITDEEQIKAAVAQVLDENGNIVFYGLGSCYSYYDNSLNALPDHVFVARRGFYYGWMDTDGNWLYCQSIFSSVNADDELGY